MGKIFLYLSISIVLLLSCNETKDVHGDILEKKINIYSIRNFLKLGNDLEYSETHNYVKQTDSYDTLLPLMYDLCDYEDLQEYYDIVILYYLKLYRLALQHKKDTIITLNIYQGIMYITKYIDYIDFF